ncbi:glycosyl hydrolase [Micromonospora sp. WMMA1363]|uniref:glycosyl hydrolase n=1 Tax=Micromonospora sp. WMMA1363 TaxID=3053985 RepID=UPI00259CF17D|nr:glycosyl hydrolase [Micromonospora sp. WMMA1363]MDM4720602.1 glycosyl hydrolase [Micromonospora sp. WMMA1363]
MHKVFDQQGATNVIWTWTPNVINYLRSRKLKAYYPGDTFVDWVGVDGYYTRRGQQTFRDLFGPTVREVRTFTKLPMLVVETGSESGSGRPAHIENLLSNVATSKDFVGVAYFNINGSGDWNIDKDAATLRAFANQAKNNVYGFDVRKVR